MATYREWDDPATEPWHRDRHNPFYRPRHRVSFTDESSLERLHVDALRAGLAVRVLATVDDSTARVLYRELHRAGVLFPRPCPSLPAPLLCREAAA